MRVLVTGGAGFIGSNFVRFLLKEAREPFDVIVLDKLTYAGNLMNLDGLDYTFVKGDIADPEIVRQILKDGVDAVLNFAAESHVDRSIMDPTSFIKTNVEGTLVLLMASMDAGVRRFIQISTDEVYGSLGPTGKFTELTPLAPNSPYAASKAAADHLVLAYHHTFGFPGIITRSSNNYGPYQFPEKVIPLFITNALEDIPLPLYGDGLNVRDWVHVKDNCEAILKVLLEGKPGEVYNIGGHQELTNLELTRKILEILGKPESLIKKVKDRPGHDRRYAMDSSKIEKEFGWRPKLSFEEGLKDTVKWYIENRDWWEKVKSGEYREYYRRMYENR